MKPIKNRNEFETGKLYFTDTYGERILSEFIKIYKKADDEKYNVGFGFGRPLLKKLARVAGGYPDTPGYKEDYYTFYYTGGHKVWEVDKREVLPLVFDKLS